MKCVEREWVSHHHSIVVLMHFIVSSIISRLIGGTNSHFVVPFFSLHRGLLYFLVVWWLSQISTMMENMLWSWSPRWWWWWRRRQNPLCAVTMISFVEDDYGEIHGKKSLMREHLTYKCISSRRIFTFSTDHPKRRRVAPKKKDGINIGTTEYIENKAVKVCCIAHSSIFLSVDNNTKTSLYCHYAKCFLCGLGYISYHPNSFHCHFRFLLSPICPVLCKVINANMLFDVFVCVKVCIYLHIQEVSVEW